jgi:2-polyprenyl-3-methyl-5-hydroxy-6-metoxy-1,4-benzoquinol methylase
MNPILGELAVEFQRGDVVDVGCGTCQLYRYLKERGWKGEYTGIDVEAYEGYSNPEGVKRILGDALQLTLPQSDTYILYDVLEHVDDPAALLTKCLNVSRNVLVAVPKRNEEMWQYGIVEYHQLDRTHKHGGFTGEELRRLVERSGGTVATYKELIPTDLVSIFRAFSGSRVLYRLIKILLAVLPSKAYYQELWCEVERR